MRTKNRAIKQPVEAMLLAGKTVEEIRQALQVGDGYISLRRKGLGLPKLKTACPNEVLVEAVEVYLEMGFNQSAIARELGMSRQRVNQIINPHKRYARNKTLAEISKGKIVRPEVCSICSKPDKLQAHHPDYSKPLEVLFVCDSCHSQLHTRQQEENKITIPIQKVLTGF